MSDSQQEAASRAAELERLRSLANRVAEKGLHMLEEEEGAQGRGGWVGWSSPQGAATTQPSARRGGRRSTPAVACRGLLLIPGAR